MKSEYTLCIINMITAMAVTHAICLAAKLVYSGVCCNAALPLKENKFQGIVKTVWTVKWRNNKSHQSRKVSLMAARQMACHGHQLLHCMTRLMWLSLRIPVGAEIL